MPTPLTRPTNYALPFANGGAKNIIPIAATGTGKASFTEGFPPVTMMPLSSGGIPPEGKDFNGILFDITAHTIWVNSGGQYQFDAALATAIGGYPAGMVLQNNAGTASYVSAVNSNSVDFNATPSSIGVQWLPYAGKAFSALTKAVTGGAVTLTATESSSRFITLTGVLASNLTLNFPAELGWWQIINNTTGAFTVTVKPTAGTGILIRQGSSDCVVSNGATMRYMANDGITMPFGDATKAFATTEFIQAALDGYYVDSGVVDNAYIITPSPALAALVHGKSFKMRTTRSNTGAATLNVNGLGAKPLVIETTAAAAAGDIHGTFTVTYDATISGGSWIMHGLAFSEFGPLAKMGIGYGLENDGANNLRIIPPMLYFMGQLS